MLTQILGVLEAVVAPAPEEGGGDLPPAAELSAATVAKVISAVSHFKVIPAVSHFSGKSFQR